jgi:hypothetical protein
LPISGLLARIRRLVPSQKDGHYEEIVRGFGNGALRPPVTPMTDRELGQAIAEFLAQAPSAEAVSNLGRRIDPTSRLWLRSIGNNAEPKSGTGELCD